MISFEALYGQNAAGSSRAAVLLDTKRWAVIENYRLDEESDEEACERVLQRCDDKKLELLLFSMSIQTGDMLLATSRSTRPSWAVTTARCSVIAAPV